MSDAVAEQVAGLVVAGLILGVGAVALTVVARRWNARVPAEWRDHPEVRDRLARESGRPGRLREAAAWLAGLVVLFTVLSLVDIWLLLQLALVLVIGARWATGWYSAESEATRALAERLGLTRPRAPAYGTALIAGMTWYAIGTVGAACFAGRLLALALGG